MKNIFIIIGLLTSTLLAQGWEMSLHNLRGVSAGYSYRPLVILGTHSDYRMFPVHTFFFNLDGKGSIISSSSSGDPTPGGFGFIFGMSAADKFSPIKSKDRYYSEYYRITELNNEKGEAMIIGGDIRIMAPFDFSPEPSIVNCYFDATIEMAYMGLSYNAIAGGFDKYVTKKVSEGGFYAGLNLGAKFFFFEVYGGLGGLFGLYKKSIDISLGDDDDEKVSNPPKTTNHFIAQAGVGVVIDLHANMDD